MTKVHDFQESLMLGQSAEDAIAQAVIAPKCKYRAATHQEQHQGIDFVGKSKQTGQVHRFQIKCDRQAAKTGNVFVEIKSGDRPGWAHTCQSDVVLYYLHGRDQLLIFSPDTLRENIEDWARKYRMAIAQNNGYQTEGILVAIPIFSSICKITRLRISL